MKPAKCSTPSILYCAACGVTQEASCDCGVRYLAITRAEYAAIAIGQRPGQSNRAIADAVGLSHQTVGRARDQLVHDGPVEKRIGLDGRARKPPEPKNPSLKLVSELPTQEEADKQWQRDIYDQAWSLLERMATETRQRYFARIRRKYADEI